MLEISNLVFRFESPFSPRGIIISVLFRSLDSVTDIVSCDTDRWYPLKCLSSGSIIGFLNSTFDMNVCAIRTWCKRNVERERRKRWRVLMNAKLNLHVSHRIKYGRYSLLRLFVESRKKIRGKRSRRLFWSEKVLGTARRNREIVRIPVNNGSINLTSHSWRLV